MFHYINKLNSYWDSHLENASLKMFDVINIVYIHYSAIYFTKNVF